jgi:hypothetical protein
VTTEQTEETRGTAAMTPDFGARGADADGRVLVVDDRVEAKFKGKGTRFYPGKVTAVTAGVGGAAATMSILYDDGDKEDGAKSENVRRVGPSRCEAALAAAPAAAPAATPAAGAAAAPAADPAAAPAAAPAGADAAAPSAGGAAAAAAAATVPAAAAPAAAVTDAAAGSAAAAARPASRPSSASASGAGAGADAFGLRAADMDGRALVVGDRVEAKFKGKGSKCAALGDAVHGRATRHLVPSPSCTNSPRVAGSTRAR